MALEEAEKIGATIVLGDMATMAEKEVISRLLAPVSW